jgi:3-phenylpropionate/trans-cinnamate dioxygenase ferredoxin subunit
MSTHQLCSLADLENNMAQRFDIDGVRLAVVRIGDEVYCINDRCSHEDFSLSEGEVLPDVCELECARHGATFDLKSGQPCSLPATTPVAHYEISIQNGMVEVVLP